MKTLKFKKFPGLLIVCTKCGKNIHKNMNAYNNCQHEDMNKHSYKAVIVDPFTKKRKTRNLESRDYAEAITELLAFKKELSNPLLHIIKPTIVKSMILKVCMADYLDYLNNIGVPALKQKIRSKGYLKTTRHFLGKFLELLQSLNYDLDKFQVDWIDIDLLGKFVEYVEIKNKAADSFNDCIKAMRIFYNYLIGNNYPVNNIFKEVRLKSSNITPLALNYNDFKNILQVISPEDSYLNYGIGNRRNMYRDWLKNAIALGAYTGRRTEELFKMKWNMLYYDEDGYPIYIKGPDLKVSRLKNLFDSDNQKMVYIPITEELLDLLLSLGYEEYKDTNRYIIAPDEVSNRNTLTNFVSKCFSFYWKKTNIKRKIGFKNLRKTYYTKLEILIKMGGLGAITISDHSTKKILEEHYIDKAEVATAIAKSGFRVFSKKEKTL